MYLCTVKFKHQIDMTKELIIREENRSNTCEILKSVEKTGGLSKIKRTRWIDSFRFIVRGNIIMV
jgi:hypothetical protein